MAQPEASQRPQLTQSEQDTRVAKIMFTAGCFFLPWLWILLLIHYRMELLDRTAPAALRGYLFASAAGTVIVTALFLTWVILFQLNWQSWGQVGLSLLIYVPSLDSWWLD